jgi:hypothetical protein
VFLIGVKDIPHGSMIRNHEPFSILTDYITFTLIGSPTSCGRSVGIVRLWTKSHGVFSLVFAPIGNCENSLEE